MWPMNDLFFSLLSLFLVSTGNDEVKSLPTSPGSDDCYLVIPICTIRILRLC